MGHPWIIICLLLFKWQKQTLSKIVTDSDNHLGGNRIMLDGDDGLGEVLTDKGTFKLSTKVENEPILRRDGGSIF